MNAARGSRLVAHTDPGLQPERTHMSWGRTLLGLILVAGLLLRWVPKVGIWAIIPVMLLTTILLIAYWRSGSSYLKGVETFKQDSYRPPVSLIITTAITLAACGALQLIMLLRQ